MSHFENNYNKENNIPGNNNTKNIQIINNSQNYEEENESKTNTNNYVNQNNKEETVSNNDNETNNEEIEEDNSEETDLEREAAILLNKQYEQIKKLKEELNKKNNEIIDLNQIIKEMNSKIQENEENFELCKKLKIQIEMLENEKNDLNIELNTKDQLIFELRSDLNTLSRKFSDLNNNLNSVPEFGSKEKMNQLMIINKRYSKDLKLKDEKIKLYEKEINKLNQNLKNEMRLKQKFEILYNEKIKEEKNWISQVNQDIGLLCQWVNNYMGVYFDKNIEIPDVPSISAPISSENILVYNKFDFEKLRKGIFEARKRVWDKQVSYEENIEKLKKEQIDFIDKINKLNRDINGLNKENLTLKEELNKRNINLDILQNQLNKYDI